MAWNRDRSELRIKEHLKSVPIFEPHITLAQDRAFRMNARATGVTIG